MMMHAGDLKRRFFVCLVLAVPVLLLSPMMGIELPFQLSFPGSPWIVAALSTVLYGFGGKPFLTGAVQELKARRPAMMTLIALGITTAYAYSMYAFVANEILRSPDHVMDFFWELATLIVIMLLGHWIEMRATASAGDALQKMAELLPAKASVRQADGSFEEVDIDQLETGQTVMVKPGEKIPADGVIEQGETTVNESLVTGEARAIAKKADSKVVGGSQNGNGTILVQVTGTGESGYLAQVMQLVSTAQGEKTKAESLADKVARLLFYAAVAAGLASLVAWYIATRNFGTAITFMVTVFVIACPHALGLAIPLVKARSTSIGAKNGLLLRHRQALEAMRNAAVVMMDKTGTLTEGAFKVIDVVSADPGRTSDEALAIMAGLEAGSSHPLAESITALASTKGIEAAPIANGHAIPGAGVGGTLADGTETLLVNARYLDEQSIAYDPALLNDAAKGSYTVSYLVIDGKVSGAIAQGDEIKGSAREAVRGMKERGLVPVMLTGDNESVASAVAADLGIETYRASLRPEDKERIVREYQRNGNVVVMVGDGINDAPSLARADVGVAIGAGTDVAVDSADAVLVRSDPVDVLRLYDLAKSTARKTTQNLWWGAGYNIVAIPLAAGVLAPIGIVLSPAVGAVLMSLSTVIVAVNALTLTIDR
ncbi:copper-translocating P-type ATPase [Raoultibacter phocaeensis]|uniref:copper-translocating P-type ATPase n=1 Tax=Raoultibacter phocaeensis TaxID=2479841 RepID=UPI0011195B8D|nr:copper-translocating P-type ATPase [Raoultibacter phocaeensis]